MRNQPGYALMIDETIYLYTDPVLAMIHVAQSDTSSIFKLSKGWTIAYQPITKEQLRAEMSKE